ncbi:hypothetical protein H310_00379 [Aphanomyces invadans]|uniref:Uncharacterized protein n=1 Tax=Aphanomyces invadans TaxID=157072 RepID=A0A024UVM4_9STRA|nr:hypothetical protein H310_00379 [Aphanomyces invadans]ETW09962.1 hypothetical protein H310_00379 [Aphanomyces invadans]|eukprot:XP_008861373.1 hypothetical protein H310_00379 [Aphanomyces invadans]
MAQPLSPSSIASDLSFVEHEDYLSSDCFSEPGSEGPISHVIGLGQPVAPLGRPTIKLPKLNPTHINIARERQIALNMIGSAQQRMVPSYIANKPPPIGKRSQNRYFNDHHFGNRAATATLEELMEHMNVSVDWKSNFEELARPENQELAEAFRNVKEPTHARTNAKQNGTHRAKPATDWTEADDMFTRVDKRARSILLSSFVSMQEFIEAVESFVVHFVQWNEVQSANVLSPRLTSWLAAPMTIDIVTPMVRDAKAAGTRSKPAKHSETVLVVPLLESPFHRLLIHATCQFYGLNSKSHFDATLKYKIMRIRRPSKRHRHPGISVSMSAFLKHCRGLLPPALVVDNQLDESAPPSSELDEIDDNGFCLVGSSEAIAV